MMTLQAVKAVIDQLSAEELREVREHLEKREQAIQSQSLTAEERIQRLDAAAKAIHDGLTAAQWEAAEHAMNDEYIESFDESEWQV